MIKDGAEIHGGKHLGIICDLVPEINELGSLVSASTHGRGDEEKRRSYGNYLITM